MLPPRPLLASAILLVGGLGWSVASMPPPAASLADAARWEGQSVTLDGWAADVRHGADGTRFTLTDGSAAVAVRVASPLDGDLVAGDRVEASGRLGRWQGELRLDVADGGGLRVVPGGKPESLGWADLAADPAAWEGRLVVLRGSVDDGRLREGGLSIALGEGPWPEGGLVKARGLVRWDAACLCHRLDAREVWPWTP